MPEFESAGFVDRNACLGCRGTDLLTVASGRYDEGPLAEFIAADPWGEDPAPFLRGQSWRLVRCAPCGLSFHRYVLDAQWNERRFSRWMSGSAIADYEARLGGGIQAARPGTPRCPQCACWTTVAATGSSSRSAAPSA